MKGRSGTSLRSKLLAPLAVMGGGLALVMLVAILVYADHAAQRQLHEKERLISTIAGNATESFNRRGELQRLASSLGASPEIKLVLMTSGDSGLVIASSNHRWIGRRLDSLPFDSVTREGIGQALHQPSFERIVLQDGELLASLSRLAYQDKGFESGILLILMDGEDLTRSFRYTSYWMALGSFCLLILLLLGIYVLLSRHVLGPVSRLSGLMRGESSPTFPSAPPSEELRILEDAWRESRQSAEAALHDLGNQKMALDHHAIVSVTDSNGVIEYVNDKFCEISGFDREELLGKSHRMVSSGLHSKAFFEDFWKTIKSGEVWSGKICNKTKGGGVYWVRATVVPLLDISGKPHQFIAIRTDITDQVAKEERLQELNRSLTIQKHLAQDLAREAEAASVAKGEFLANMSHEIRTPLNGVIGMTNLLLLGELLPDQKKRARIILECAEFLLVLINDILDFSKIEAGKLELVEEPFRLSELLESIVTIFNLTIEEKGLVLLREDQANLPEALVGDPGRLRQILVNLLGNAVKFTEAGSIRLRTEVLDQEDSAVLLRVSIIDTGIGIDPSRIERLFTSFTQVDSSITRKYGGTGLGLAISKQLASLMGGDMGVESVPGAGSTFWFTLRLKVVEPLPSRASAPLPGTVPSEPGQPRKARILVADDNDVNRMVCTEILEMAGYEVATAEDGQQALEAVFGAESFDLVLMDMQMPLMDGLTATREIRSRATEHRRKSIPILALTANAMSRDIERCTEAGMDGFVAKPIDSRLLLAQIQRQLGRNDESDPLSTAPSNFPIPL